MRLNFPSLFFLASGIVFLTGCTASNSASKKQLQVTFGARGLEQLNYGDTILEDLEQNPADAFHIWHLRTTDLQGKVMTGKQYEWGEVNNGKSWDAAKNTWKYTFSWGSISLEFALAGDTLNMNVTEVNNADSGIILNGATVYPFVLHFPQLPKDFKDVKFQQLFSNTTKERVVVADFGQGQVASFVPGPPKPLYHGFDPVGTGFSYTPIISSTSMDGMAPFFPRIDRPVKPGTSETFTVSLRFAPSGTLTTNLQ
jgi:hypothetical protein